MLDVPGGLLCEQLLVLIETEVIGDNGVVALVAVRARE